MLFKRLFFDLDGTLIDSKEGITLGVSHALRQFGINKNPDELLMCIGPPLEYSFRKFFGLSKADAAQAIRYHQDYYSEKGIFQSIIYPGTLEMLKKLLSTGYTLYMATSKEEEYALQLADYFKMSGYFSGIAGADIDSGRLNKEEVLRHLCQKQNITYFEDCLMIGDREHDMHGAHALGMKAAGVLYGYGSRNELEEAGADYIFENNSTLTAWLCEPENKG